MTTPEIARLNPFDGLFLRAVHLQQIQLYAQALSRALGLAGGPGVVYGYGLALASAPGEPPSRLDVQPGLAVDADGRILLSESTIRVDLPEPGQTLAWRVELVGKDEPFGQENSYGDICVDPCGAAVSTAPFVGEGVDEQAHPAHPARQAGPGLARVPEPRGLVVLRTGAARGRPDHRGVRPGPRRRPESAHHRHQLGGTDRAGARAGRDRPATSYRRGIRARRLDGTPRPGTVPSRNRVDEPAGDAAVAGVHRPAPAVPGPAWFGLARPGRDDGIRHAARNLCPRRRVDPADRGTAADAHPQGARAHRPDRGRPRGAPRRKAHRASD